MKCPEKGLFLPRCTVRDQVINSQTNTNQIKNCNRSHAPLRVLTRVVAAYKKNTGPFDNEVLAFNLMLTTGRFAPKGLHLD